MSDPSDVQALTALLQQQLAAASEREKRLTNLVEKTLQQVPQPSSTSPPASNNSQTVSAKPVSVDRPLLASSATLADFTAWSEAWADYALRQTLDEDLRRFLREGVISLPANPDSPDVIAALRSFIRRQRNPLLDRIFFYDRTQQRGETFDNFYTSLRKSFNQSNFPDMKVCTDCESKVCSPC